jgi:hypothetical protein
MYLDFLKGKVTTDIGVTFVFWNIMPCIRFWRTCRLHLHGWRVSQARHHHKASSKQGITLRYSPEKRTLHNLKFYTSKKSCIIYIYIFFFFCIHPLSFMPWTLHTEVIRLSPTPKLTAPATCPKSQSLAWWLRAEKDQPLQRQFVNASWLSMYRHKFSVNSIIFSLTNIVFRCQA